MARKSPGFTFYAKDFLADTALLTAQAVGAYWRLCCYAWVGMPGYPQCHLPGDDRRLAKLAGVSMREWATIRGDVMELFLPAGDGVVCHKRLLEELGLQHQKSEKARRGASSRWNADASQDRCEIDANASVSHASRIDSAYATREGARKAVADANASSVVSGEGSVGEGSPPGPPDDPQPTVSPSGRPIPPAIVIRPQPTVWQPAPPLTAEQLAAERQDAEDFERFWAAYPKRRRNVTAQRAWAQTRHVRPPIGELLAIVAELSATPDWQEEGGKYVLEPANWLLESGWLERTGEATAPQYPVGLGLTDHRNRAVGTLSDLHAAGKLDTTTTDQLCAEVERAPNAAAVAAIMGRVNGAAAPGGLA